MHFKINLTLIAALVIVLFFNIPFYNNWLNSNLLNPAISISTLSKQLGEAERKTSRFGYSYMVYTELPGIFKSAKIADPLVLLPPQAYLNENKVKDFSVVEPTIFYYFTGYKAVWYNSPGVEKANCVLVPDGHGRVMLSKISSPEELNKLLAIYKKYKLDL